ncbi:MAG TPA: aminoacyl-tRNA hydrolase [Thermoanaerobacterales bacterium]|nr:aminoacyl-tRNA hydrolase [Thermoanaerobacterales bacterium]
MYIIVGLGNPGSEYEITRHNAGFMAVDYLAKKNGIKINKLKHKALVGEGKIAGENVMLAKPLTYMNLSGRSVKDIFEQNCADLEKLIIIYDDMDLDLGKIRIRVKGSSGTHNGMKSIIYQLQTEDFPRIRIGIGACPEGIDAVDYVLSPFSAEEQKIIGEVVKKIAEAVETIIMDGIPAAMNKYN